MINVEANVATRLGRGARLSGALVNILKPNLPGGPDCYHRDEFGSEGNAKFVADLNADTEFIYLPVGDATFIYDFGRTEWVLIHVPSSAP